MNEVDYGPVQDAMDTLRKLSRDPEMREKAFQRERAISDWVTDVATAEKRGKAEGRAEGQEKGIEIAMEAIKKRLIALGMSEEEASAIANPKMIE